MRRTLSPLVALLGLSPSRGQEEPVAVERLVADLASPLRTARQAAEYQLLEWGEEIRPALLACEIPTEFEPSIRLRYILQHLPPAPTSVAVPAGTYLVGSGDLEDANPKRRVVLAGFQIDVTEVTCVEYFRYLRATGATAPSGWKGGRYPYGWDQLPATGVTFGEAQRYAAWVGGRLPTADEWEVAGHGGRATPYPWGDQPLTPLRNFTGDPVPVRAEERDRSPFGCYDLAGSVSEWVLLDGKPAYRGGYYLGPRHEQLRLTRRAVPVSDPAMARDIIGFRLVNRQRPRR